MSFHLLQMNCILKAVWIVWWIYFVFYSDSCHINRICYFAYSTLFNPWMRSKVRVRDQIYVKLRGRTIHSFLGHTKWNYNISKFIKAVKCLIFLVLRTFVGFRALGMFSISHIAGTRVCCELFCHYRDAIMGAIASQITSLTIVYSTIYSDADKKNQSSASLAFVRGIHRSPVKSPHKGQ